MATVLKDGVYARNVRRIAHIDIPGGGQVNREGNLVFVGHMDPPAGTSIIDVSDIVNPRVLCTMPIGGGSHSHKVRVKGNIMLINNENHTRHLRAAGLRLNAERERMTRELGRTPTDAELCDALNFKVADIPAMMKAAEKEYDGAGLRIFDIAYPASPKEIGFFKTHGNGVHRFDFDGRYAYLSTGMEGYQANIVVILDMKDPADPKEVSRWWLPGQWLAGGEKPNWGKLRFECHHPLRYGDRLYVSYHAAGMVILDISDITKPKMLSHYNYHPPFRSSTHTYARMPYKIAGKDIAVVVDEQPGRPRPGHVPAFMWIFDVTEETDPQPISSFSITEAHTPCQLGDINPRVARFGAHQCHERMRDSLVYVCWFRGGLRIVDIRDPAAPEEVGYFVPDPDPGRATVQSNDIFVDDDGYVYLLDRYRGLDILEYTGPAGVKGDT
jgi:hypothetical protein